MSSAIVFNNAFEGPWGENVTHAWIPGRPMSLQFADAASPKVAGVRDQ
jgi:hypothetical protein